MRMRVEINDNNPLMARFWWTNSQGKYRWASVKYEQLSDYYYGCGMLRHTTQTCQDEVQMPEQDPNILAYGPWLVGVRPKNMVTRQASGNEEGTTCRATQGAHRTWSDIMRNTKVTGLWNLSNKQTVIGRPCSVNVVEMDWKWNRG